MGGGQVKVGRRLQCRRDEVEMQPLWLCLVLESWTLNPKP